MTGFETPANRPEVLLIGGPNGAGKTTAASVLLPEGFQVDRFVNADLIAQSLSPFAPERSAFAAGRLMLERIREHYRAQVSFGFESTLASRTFAPFLMIARSAGYLVHITYVWVRSPDLAIDRVRARVRAGGHDVPESTVRRRYGRSIRNFFELYQPLADTWLICDNSRGHVVRVAVGRAGVEPTIHDHATFTVIKKQAADAGHDD